MPTYKAPLEDIRFLLNEVINAGELAKLPGYSEATPDSVDTILDAAAQMCEEVLFPLNQSGDSEGCHFDNGVVTTPAGFKDAYKMFRESGWTGLSCNPDFGGQGLPLLLNFVIDEMVCSANLSFGMYPGLSHGAYNAIEKHGSDILEENLPSETGGWFMDRHDVSDGKPQCGTDSGLIRTKAMPSADGSYRLTGTKIFKGDLGGGARPLGQILSILRSRAPARCACRHERYQPFPRAKVFSER